MKTLHRKEKEQLQVQISGEKGFHMLQHKMEIYGICFDCMENRVRIMPLTTGKQGERLVIEEFKG